MLCEQAYASDKKNVNLIYKGESDTAAVQHKDGLI